MSIDLNLGSINHYIDRDDADEVENIKIAPDSTLNVESFDNEESRYWNESLQKLYEEYKELVSKMDINDNGEYNSLSIKQGGDAGYHFNEGAPYVIPDKNIDNESYEDVRGNDKIESVLENSEELQFTRKKNNEKGTYIRLIMPKYIRRVEVEDLNRNFWVIGQTLEQICGFLFNSDSPLNIILKNILNELLGIWQNIYLLWGKAKDNEAALNELGSQSAKSNLRVHFNNEGSDCFVFLKDEIYRQTGIDISESLIENNAKLENIYFFGSKKDESGVELNPIPEWFEKEEAAIEAVYPWLFDEHNNFIYENVEEVDNMNGYENYYPFCGQYLEAEDRKILTFPRIGGIAKYTLNDKIYYLSYDYKHPLIVPTGKENVYYGSVMKYAVAMPDLDYENGTKSGQTIFSLNRYIYEESKDKILGSNISSLGIIALERSGFDKRNFSEILYDLSQLNITYLSNTMSASNMKTVCDWDMIPSEQKYSREDLYKAIITVFAKTCDYGITAVDDYYYTGDENGSGDEIIFVHTGLMPLLLESLRRENIIGQDETINDVSKYFYVEDTVYLNYLKRISSDKYKDLLEVYPLYDFKSLSSYTKFVNKILKTFGISFSDYCQENEITTININNINSYKNDYEAFCEQKISELSDDELLYLNKKYYPENGVYGYVISNPFLICGFNDSGTGYATYPYLTYADDDFRKNYYLTKNMQDCTSNTWKCVFSLIPQNAFTNENKLKNYENKLMTVKEHYELPTEQGGGSESVRRSLLHKKIYGTESSLTEAYNTKILQEKNEHFGVISGFEVDNPKNIKTQFLQPFEKFTGYWLYMESGSFLTNFLATPRISGYNLRALDGAGDFSFYDSAFILKAFNPYDPKDDIFNNETINKIYEFNNPEIQPLYLHSPDEIMKIRPTIYNRGKSDKIRYLSRNGNIYKGVVDSLIGVGRNIKWGNGLESYTISSSENGVSYKSYLNSLPLSQEEREKINFDTNTTNYLNIQTALVDINTKKMLFETDLSDDFKTAEELYLSNNSASTPIYSPIFWTNNGGSWREWLREFHFLQASPYDSIHVLDDAGKEMSTKHKTWKEFTVGELSNSTEIYSITSLIEFLKDTITDYNTVKTLIRFSVVREYEADNNNAEIAEMTKDPSNEIINDDSDSITYGDETKWTIPEQISEKFKNDNKTGILDKLNEKDENGNDKYWNSAVGATIKIVNNEIETNITVNAAVEIDSNSIDDTTIKYYDITIQDYISDINTWGEKYKFRVIRAGENRGYYPYYITGKCETTETEDRYYDFGNLSNTNTMKDANNKPINGIGSIWKSRYDLYCWYNRIPLIKDTNSIYPDYLYNYTINIGEFYVIGVLDENNMLSLPKTVTSGVDYSNWVGSPYEMSFDIDGVEVKGFYDSIRGYGPQTSLPYSGDWKIKKVGD